MTEGRTNECIEKKSWQRCSVGKWARLRQYRPTLTAGQDLSKLPVGNIYSRSEFGLACSFYPDLKR